MDGVREGWAGVRLWPVRQNPPPLHPRPKHHHCRHSLNQLRLPLIRRRQDAVIGRGTWFMAFLRDLGSASKRPWWVVLLAAVIIGGPQAANALRDWYEALRDLGGSAATLLAALASPVLRISLIVLGILGVAYADNETEFGRALGAFGRLLAVALIAVCAAAGLFGYLIASSDIPAAVKHYQRTTVVRHVTPRQREVLFQEFRRTADSIPSFQVLAGRSPETIQYASDLVDILFAAGLSLENGIRPGAKAITTDPRSVNHRGLMIAVKNPAEPSRAAALLGNALKAAEIECEYIILTGETGDKFLVLVGPN